MPPCLNVCINGISPFNGQSHVYLHPENNKKATRMPRFRPDNADKYVLPRYLIFFSQRWFASVQDVLQADWQDVWHSPQPVFSFLSLRLPLTMCFIPISLSAYCKQKLQTDYIIGAALFATPFTRVLFYIVCAVFFAFSPACATICRNSPQ